MGKYCFICSYNAMAPIRNSFHYIGHFFKNGNLMWHSQNLLQGVETDIFSIYFKFKALKCVFNFGYLKYLFIENKYYSLFCT